MTVNGMSLHKEGEGVRKATEHHPCQAEWTARAEGQGEGLWGITGVVIRHQHRPNYRLV